VQPGDGDRGLNGEQALQLARSWGVRTAPSTRQLLSDAYDVIPEYREQLERGGPLLDVGCGVGGALLTTLTLVDKLQAVGIEIVPEVAGECARRARDLGVADRVDIRTMDARALTEESVFTACFWAQPFFPDDVRADTLAAILRALRPGGVLLMQELFPPQNAEDEPTTGSRLDRLFFRRQHIPFGRSAEELAEEGGAAGFRDARIAASAMGRLVVMHKPE
jgi:cyclopropane fatty-acyl-phospholipid synthase-like methyltransferase